jgi:hypothetical protein
MHLHFFSLFLVSQLAPTIMTSLATQHELSLIRKASRVEVPSEMVYARRNQGAAFTLACDASGLEDKEIALDLGIDAGTFSRMKDGKNTLSADRMRDFCEVVGNTILPQWIAYQVGCGLVMLKTEAERRAELAEARAIDAEKKLAWAMEIMQGKKSA